MAKVKTERTRTLPVIQVRATDAKSGDDVLIAQVQGTGRAEASAAIVKEYLSDKFQDVYYSVRRSA